VTACVVPVVPTVMFAGQVIVGGWVSRTVTVKEQLTAAEPWVCMVTVVIPTGKNEPEGGLAETVASPPVQSAFRDAAG